MTPVMRKAAPALAVLGGVCFVWSFFTVVPAGHVGVPVVSYIPEGLHAVNPFANVEPLSVRTETYTMVSAPSA